MLRKHPTISADDETVKSKLESEWLWTRREAMDFETADSCPIASATKISAKAQPQLILFDKKSNQVVASSSPAGFKRSFESGAAFGGVMAYNCAPVAHRSKQTLTIIIQLNIECNCLGMLLRRNDCLPVPVRCLWIEARPQTQQQSLDSMRTD